MQQHGASAGAVAFYRLTAWFLTELEDTGVVKLGIILNPWRANEIVQSALLGGIPAVIFPEVEGRQVAVAVQFNETFRRLRAEYPDAIVWIPGSGIEGVEPSPQGGQRFILSYRVLDGCHACALLGEARVAFDFAPDGTYMGLDLLEVVVN